MPLAVTPRVTLFIYSFEGECNGCGRQSTFCAEYRLDSDFQGWTRDIGTVKNDCKCNNGYEIPELPLTVRVEEIVNGHSGLVDKFIDKFNKVFRSEGKKG